MPSLQEVKTANASIKTAQSQENITAVFTGATRGIGLATLEAFAQHVPKPTAIIVGRSASRFDPHLARLRSMNPAGTFTFIEHDIELLRDVDATSKLIISALEGRKIDILYTSQGYISFAGRETNADGLDRSISLRYHGRVRFTQNLLPCMSETARSVSILAGSKEGKVIEDDLELERNYSVLNSMNHYGTLMSLSYDSLAKAHPQKTFVHVFPGEVNTGLLSRSATGILGWFFGWVVEPLMGLFAPRAEDVGERMLYYGTSGQVGAGMWTLNQKGEQVENEVLKGYRARGYEKVVEQHYQEVVERVAGTA